MTLSMNDSTIPAVGNYKIKREQTSGLYLALNSRRSPEPFRSKQIVITAEVGGLRAKILSIFWEKDLGYYVHLGYFNPPHAVVGRSVISTPPGEPKTINLRENGEVSTRRLKFSHHASGQAHFSLHGRNPLVEARAPALAVNHSAPPDKRMGYVFSAMFRGLKSFEPVKPVSPSDTVPLPKNRRQLNFRYDGTEATPRKLLGWWFPIKALSITDYGDGLPWEPKPVHFWPDGKTVVTGFLIAPPEDWPWSEHGLVISDDTPSAPTSPLDTYLVFQGGFTTEQDARGNDAGDSFIVAIFSDQADCNELQN
jgi:hypothetical protein